MVNDDHGKLQKKIITELSKPVYPFDETKKGKGKKEPNEESKGNMVSKDQEFEERRTYHLNTLMNQNKM